MRRLPLLFVVFSVLVFSSCAVPEEASPLPQDVVSEVNVPQPPSSPAVETERNEAFPAAEDSGAESDETAEIVYPFVGDEDAPVAVVEYGDFSDGTNSFVTTSQVASIKRDYVASGKAKLIFKPFPLNGNDEAKMASEASWCMWEQGSKQFWAYHNTLFAFYLHLDYASLNNYASRVPNVDKAALAECLDSGRYASRVVSTLEEGKKKGFGKVPAFVIGDSVLEGNVPYKKLKSAIEAELGSVDGNLITGSAVLSQISAHNLPKAILEFIESVFRKI